MKVTFLKKIINVEKIEKAIIHNYLPEKKIHKTHLQL